MLIRFSGVDRQCQLDDGPLPVHNEALWFDFILSALVTLIRAN